MPQHVPLVLPYAPRPKGRGYLNPLWAVVVGAAYGLLDVHLPGSVSMAIPLVLVLAAGIVLGAFRGWMWFPIISVCLYLSHVIVIATGYRGSGYVEEDAVEALGCFLSLVPAGIGAAIGAAVSAMAGSRSPDAAASPAL